MAAAVLWRLGRGADIGQRFAAQPAAAGLATMLQRELNCPPSSSLGRVFDAAAGLLGVRQVAAFEGQAAMLLEGLAARHPGAAPWEGAWRIAADGRLDLLPLLGRLADAHDAPLAAARFHASLVAALAEWVAVTAAAALSSGTRTVALGGGCFLNDILTRDLAARLGRLGLRVLLARQLPPNDGGLSLGQAWVARHCLED